MVPRIFRSWQQKIPAIVDESRNFSRIDRAVLIGTRSVETSEQISAALAQAGIEHRVLNARMLEKEAKIVANAGQPGYVTVATNMAGRGTDIKLHERTRTAGGLHVILSEIHESARIDWQLIGRGSRQGDPGSYRLFLSLEDEILRAGLGPAATQGWQKRFADSKELPTRLLSLFLKAQRHLERKHLTDRMILLKQDRERHRRHFESGSDPFLDVIE